MSDEKESPSMSTAEAEAKRGLGPVAAARLAMLGPRAHGASTTKGYFYLAMAAIVLAIMSQCNARSITQYARENARPRYVYIDPTGHAFLALQYNPGERPQIDERALIFHAWDVCQKTYSVYPYQTGEYQKWLMRYYFDGAATRYFTKHSNEENILGSAQEKASVIAAGKKRTLEAVSIVPKDSKVESDGTQTGTLEMTFYARTYSLGVDEPELMRAYRVTYTYAAGTFPRKVKTPHEQDDFLRNNPITFRVLDFDLREVSLGAIPRNAGNQGPQQGQEATALTPTGAGPTVPEATTGGPVGRLVPPAAGPSTPVQPGPGAPQGGTRATPPLSPAN